MQVQVHIDIDELRQRIDERSEPFEAPGPNRFDRLFTQTQPPRTDNLNIASEIIGTDPICNANPRV